MHGGMLHLLGCTGSWRQLLELLGCVGCLHLLQSWIHKYFPHTRHSVVHPEPHREGEPLCGGGLP
ncbi:hypothetical protein LINGRAHAP2_LOCUS5262 [Linum grandiflorum]